MPEILTRSIATGDTPILAGVIISTIVSIVLGLAVSVIYRYKHSYSQSMVVGLVIMPPMVQIVIMLVNANIGVGLAVAGAFSLIRFRSMPGDARDIGHLFFATALGFVGLTSTATMVAVGNNSCKNSSRFPISSAV